MSSGAQLIGAGVVQVKADDTQFRDALSKLPALAQQKIDLTMRSIQDRIAKKRFNLVFETDPTKIRKLEGELDTLERKLNQVKLNAIDMGGKLDSAAGKAAAGAVKAAAAADRMGVQWANAANRAAQAERDLLAKIEATGTATGRAGAARGASLDAAGRDAAKAGSRAAQGLYQIGAAVDDIQYGFRGVLNNIPQVAMAFGSAGLAGGIAIAVTAAYQLYMHMDELMNLLGKGTIKSAADQMKELADQTSRSADEQQRLTKAKRQEEAVEGQEKDRPKHIEESAKKTREAITEAGRQHIREGLKQSGIVGPDAAEKSRLEDELAQLEQKKKMAANANFGGVEGLVGGLANTFYFDKEIKKKKKEIRDLHDKATGEYLADVENNEKGRREQFMKDLAEHPERYGQGKTPEEKAASGKKLLETLKKTAPAEVKKELEGKSPEAKTATKEAKHAEKVRKGITNTLRRFGQSVKRKADAQLRKNAAVTKAEAAKRARTARGFAAPMSKGGIGRKLLRNPKADITNDVIANLMGQGVKAGKARDMAGEIVAAIQASVGKRISDRVGKFGGTAAEAGKFLADKEERDENKRKLRADDVKREADQRVDDAKERVSDAKYKVRQAFMGSQKSQVMGLQEFLNSQLTGSLNGQDRQRELLEAMKDQARAERELTDAIRKKADLIAVAAPG